MLNRLNPIQNIDTSKIAHKYILRWQRPIVQRRKRCLSFCPSNERLGSMISEIPTQGLNIFWMMFIFIFSLKMKILIVMAPTRFFKTSSWVTITTRQFSNIHVPHLIQIRCPSINILKSIMISTLRYFVIVMKMLIVYIIIHYYNYLRETLVSPIFTSNTSLVDRKYKTSMAILNKYNS